MHSFIFSFHLSSTYEAQSVPYYFLPSPRLTRVGWMWFGAHMSSTTNVGKFRKITNNKERGRGKVSEQIFLSWKFNGEILNFREWVIAWNQYQHSSTQTCLTEEGIKQIFSISIIIIVVVFLVFCHPKMYVPYVLAKQWGLPCQATRTHTHYLSNPYVCIGISVCLRLCVGVSLI